MSERLSLRGARRTFGPQAGLLGLDLHVAAGEIHALVGLNGAGKTTLMRAALGMLRLDSGEVCIDGRRLEQLPATAWRRVGHLVEQPFAYPELGTRTNVQLAARLRGSDLDCSEAVLAELDLERYAAVPARKLSQGNRQRLGLAVALQHEPELIILDEPTNALDPAGVLLLRRVLQRRANGGAGILVSSHHLDEVARIADRISVLNRGRIVGSLDPAGQELERAFFELVRADDESRRS
ncbi:MULTISPECIES: ABC transporter ATP-binding protein [unclassified Brachybacterium]|uniref:ABC transporter ATP-binding protein n=1 Tax=unclassified Brachybacterium TaxID=2623841 RepID=UPI0036120040